MLQPTKDTPSVTTARFKKKAPLARHSISRDPQGKRQYNLWPARRGIPRLNLQRALGLCVADRHRAAPQRTERGGETHALEGSSAFSNVFEPDDMSKTCPQQAYLQRGSVVLSYDMMVCRAVRALNRGGNA